MTVPPRSSSASSSYSPLGSAGFGSSQRTPLQTPAYSTYQHGGSTSSYTAASQPTPSSSSGLVRDRSAKTSSSYTSGFDRSGHSSALNSLTASSSTYTPSAASPGRQSRFSSSPGHTSLGVGKSSTSAQSTQPLGAYSSSLPSPRFGGSSSSQSALQPLAPASGAPSAPFSSSSSYMPSFGSSSRGGNSSPPLGGPQTPLEPLQPLGGTGGSLTPQTSLQPLQPLSGAGSSFAPQTSLQPLGGEGSPLAQMSQQPLQTLGGAGSSLSPQTSLQPLQPLSGAGDSLQPSQPLSDTGSFFAPQTSLQPLQALGGAGSSVAQQTWEHMQSLSGGGSSLTSGASLEPLQPFNAGVSAPMTSQMPLNQSGVEDPFHSLDALEALSGSANGFAPVAGISSSAFGESESLQLSGETQPLQPLQPLFGETQPLQPLQPFVGDTAGPLLGPGSSSDQSSSAAFSGLQSPAPLLGPTSLSSTPHPQSSFLDSPGSAAPLVGPQHTLAIGPHTSGSVLGSSFLSGSSSSAPLVGPQSSLNGFQPHVDTTEWQRRVDAAERKVDDAELQRVQAEARAARAEGDLRRALEAAEKDISMTSSQRPGLRLIAPVAQLLPEKVWISVASSSGRPYEVDASFDVGACAMIDDSHCFTSLGGFTSSNGFVYIRCSSYDKDISSEQSLCTLTSTAAFTIYLIYHSNQEKLHTTRRPWIASEFWRVDNTLTKPTWSRAELFTEVRWKTFPCGSVSVKGHNGNGCGAPLVFVKKASLQTTGTGPATPEKPAAPADGASPSAFSPTPSPTKVMKSPFGKVWRPVPWPERCNEATQAPDPATNTEDAEAHGKAPQCSHCRLQMEWSDHLPKFYKNGWMCYNSGVCGSSSRNCGDFRWFCKVCCNDTCMKCGRVQEVRRVVDWRVENEDTLQGDAVTMHLLSYHPLSATAQTTSVFIVVKFFVFPPQASAVLDPRRPRSIEGGALAPPAIRFITGDADKGVDDDHARLARYLGTRSVEVEVWSGDALMQLGSARVDLFTLLRQGKGQTTLEGEFAVLEKEHGELIGWLQLVLTCQGFKVHNHTFTHLRNAKHTVRVHARCKVGLLPSRPAAAVNEQSVSISQAAPAAAVNADMIRKQARLQEWERLQKSEITREMNKSAMGINVAHSRKRDVGHQYQARHVNKAHERIDLRVTSGVAEYFAMTFQNTSDKEEVFHLALWETAWHREAASTTPTSSASKDKVAPPQPACSMTLVSHPEKWRQLVLQRGFKEPPGGNYNLFVCGEGQLHDESKSSGACPHCSIAKFKLGPQAVLELPLRCLSFEGFGAASSSTTPFATLPFHHASTKTYEARLDAVRKIIEKSAREFRAEIIWQRSNEFWTSLSAEIVVHAWPCTIDSTLNFNEPEGCIAERRVLVESSIHEPDTISGTVGAQACNLNSSNLSSAASTVHAENQASFMKESVVAPNLSETQAAVHFSTHGATSHSMVIPAASPISAASTSFATTGVALNNIMAPTASATSVLAPIPAPQIYPAVTEAAYLGKGSTHQQNVIVTPASKLEPCCVYCSDPTVRIRWVSKNEISVHFLVPKDTHALPHVFFLVLYGDLGMRESLLNGVFESEPLSVYAIHVNGLTTEHAQVPIGIRTDATIRLPNWTDSSDVVEIWSSSPDLCQFPSRVLHERPLPFTPVRVKASIISQKLGIQRCLMHVVGTRSSTVGEIYPRRVLAICLVLIEVVAPAVDKVHEVVLPQAGVVVIRELQISNPYASSQWLAIRSSDPAICGVVLPDITLPGQESGNVKLRCGPLQSGAHTDVFLFVDSADNEMQEVRLIRFSCP